MANERRKCRLADVKFRGVDLRKYAPIIIATIEKTVAGKNPKVYNCESRKNDNNYPFLILLL